MEARVLIVGRNTVIISIPSTQTKLVGDGGDVREVIGYCYVYIEMVTAAIRHAFWTKLL